MKLAPNFIRESYLSLRALEQDLFEQYKKHRYAQVRQLKIFSHPNNSQIAQLVLLANCDLRRKRFSAQYSEEQFQQKNISFVVGYSIQVSVVENSVSCFAFLQTLLYCQQITCSWWTINIFYASSRKIQQNRYTSKYCKSPYFFKLGIIVY